MKQIAGDGEVKPQGKSQMVTIPMSLLHKGL